MEAGPVGPGGPGTVEAGPTGPVGPGGPGTVDAGPVGPGGPLGPGAPVGPVGPATPVDHVPSPRQNVEELAPEPLPKLATGRLPVTLVARFTNCVDVVPVPPDAIGSAAPRVTDAK